MNPDGSGAVDLTPPGYIDVRSFAWSPDGTRIAFGDRGRRPGSRDLRPEPVERLCAAADEQLSARLRAEPVAGRPLHRLHEHPHRPLADLPDALRRERAAAVDERAGQLRLARVGAARQPDRVPLRDGRGEDLGHAARRDAHPHAATTGRDDRGRPGLVAERPADRLARGTRGPAWRGLGIWTIRPDGRGAHRVFAGGGDPSYSHDGRWLAFVWNRNGNQELYKVRATGEGLAQLTNTYGITEGAPAWRP